MMCHTSDDLETCIPPTLENTSWLDTSIDPLTDALLKCRQLRQREIYHCCRRYRGFNR